MSPTKFPGGPVVNPENAARFSEMWGHPVPAEPGLDTGAMMDAAHAGAIDVLYNIGGNLYATMPDPDFMKQAFKNIRLRIHQDINLNTSTLIEPGEAILLLPAQTRYEQRGGGTSTSTERRIRFSPEIPGHPTVGETKPEYEIPALVACAARPELSDALKFASSQAIRDEIGEVMPVYKGIERLSKEGDWIQWGGPHLGAGGVFPAMPDQRAQFIGLVPPKTELEPGLFFLSNRRGKQFNSMVFAAEDTLQGGLGRSDVFVNQADADQLGVRDGSAIRLHNDYGEMDGIVRIENIKEGNLQAYWPEANPLVPRVYDPVSREPDYNAQVRVEVISR